MAHVLLVGESWFTYTTHQKGFDAFASAEYTEGGASFLDALREYGHETSYLPSHLVDREFPDELASYDVVAISDVGANTFQLASRTFTRSQPSPDRTETIRAYVENGGALLTIGGYLSFSGIDAKARWGRTPLAAALPVEVLDRDDRVELPAGAVPEVRAPGHPAVSAVAGVWPALLGLNQVTARADVLVECAGHPLLITGEYGSGRTAAFTSDIAPHWAPPEFVSWPGYGQLWDGVVRWLHKES
ncbi:glutamine amidotransferase [Cryptosporangium phraense]|uniref:Cytoplasmic protein n=1 Tax=Cryptosporangium phraense TaxID=2593070 RepID=A0A545AFT1_9ACTN|nr:glutamine amidotransferase [Cryptosporangium phraense]TQS40187.1 cytoplasmic protein [Cryptosporangium phraense]